MENPAGGGASEDCQLGGDTRKHTAPPYNIQVTLIQVTLDRAWRHEFTAEALGSLLALRLDRPQRFLLAIGGLMALDPEDRETVAETALADLRAGPPVPPFHGMMNEAELWVAFASRVEVKNYLVACWNALSEHDRRAFLRRAI